MSTNQATNWADALPEIALAMNLQAHSSLSADTCPYHVFFGREERWPEQISHLIKQDEIAVDDEILSAEEERPNLQESARLNEWQPSSFVFDEEIDEEVEAERQRPSEACYEPRETFQQEPVAREPIGRCTASSTRREPGQAISIDEGDPGTSTGLQNASTARATSGSARSQPVPFSETPIAQEAP